MTYVYVVLAIFFILNFKYNLFSFFLENFGKSFTDIVVISLTLVLMTATLGLLAFTYNTIVDDGNTKDNMELIGVDYFKSTLFVIFFSFGLFLLFIILKLFGLNDWTVLLNGNYSIIFEINVVCMVIFVSTYFMIRFLEYFLKATKDCLKELELI